MLHHRHGQKTTAQRSAIRRRPTSTPRHQQGVRLFLVIKLEHLFLNATRNAHVVSCVYYHSLSPTITRWYISNSFSIRIFACLHYSYFRHTHNMYSKNDKFNFKKSVAYYQTADFNCSRDEKQTIVQPANYQDSYIVWASSRTATCSLKWIFLLS